MRKVTASQATVETTTVTSITIAWIRNSSPPNRGSVLSNRFRISVNAAVETNQDDLAVILIQKKNGLDQEVLEMRGDLDTASKDADSAKSSLLQVQAEIKKLKAERDVMLARMQSAQARLQIQGQLDGLSVDAEVKALDNVREHIKTTVAAANLGKELSETSLDARLASLKDKAGDVQAKQQLAEIKAKRAAQQSAQAQKTM